MTAGRPTLFTSPEELQELVDAYFKTEEQVTLSGLAVFLGMGRRTLYDYEKKDEFSHIIKKAREKVEAVYENRLLYHSNPTGVIFALKNMGWKDRTESDVNIKELPRTLLDGLHSDDGPQEAPKS